MDHNGNNKNEFGWFADKPKVPKRLYNFKAVALGLAIFLILVTSPLWRSLGKVVPAPDPPTQYPGHYGPSRKRPDLCGEQGVHAGQPHAAVK